MPGDTGADTADPTTDPEQHYKKVNGKFVPVDKTTGEPVKPKGPDTQEGGLGGVRHDIAGWLNDLSGTGYHQTTDGKTQKTADLTPAAQKEANQYTDFPGGDTPSEALHVASAGLLGSDATPASDPKKKTKAKSLPQPTETPQTEWEQLNDQLATSYGATIAALNPANDSVASQNAATDSSMSSDAEADLGQAGNSPMGQWLNAQNAAVASQSQATTAAEQAQVAAEDKGAGVIQNAIKGLGTAEQQQQTYAPYQQLLQSLAADVPYQLLSGNTLSSVQSNVQNAIDQIGLGGKIPLTDTSPNLPSPTTSASSNSALALSLATPSTNTSQGQ